MVRKRGIRVITHLKEVHVRWVYEPLRSESLVTGSGGIEECLGREQGPLIGFWYIFYGEDVIGSLRGTI